MITITLPITDDLVRLVDSLAAQEITSRAAWIRRAILDRIDREAQAKRGRDRASS